ncbi:MAG: formimidoylglutamase [Bacteroidales bacterium]|nr:formimidoylglutamase [Bacteroidales bacterium]
MDLNLYFEPVALDKPEHALSTRKTMLGHNIRINTPDTPIDEISNYQVALLGVGEDRNSLNRGSSESPDKIRNQLYQLYRMNEKVRIIDLGNLKSTGSLSDTYFGVRDVLLELLGNQLVVIVMGGTQDITYGAYMALERMKETVNVVSVDPRLDLTEGESGDIRWMEEIMKSPKLFQYTNLGHQQYLVDNELLERFEKHSFEAVRLGMLRDNLGMSEPYLRDAHIVSFDVAAIKQSDSPGTMFPSPNGFVADEACRLARYAGLSDRVSCFGIFEANPLFDRHDQTTHLGAQIIWYFIDGFVQRRSENPGPENPDFKVFIIGHQDMEHELTFYKSMITNRWWMEVPDIGSGRTVMVSCSCEEYQQAGKHEIPDLWWKVYQRIN